MALLRREKVYGTYADQVCIAKFTSQMFMLIEELERPMSCIR